MAGRNPGIDRRVFGMNKPPVSVPDQVKGLAQLLRASTSILGHKVHGLVCCNGSQMSGVTETRRHGRGCLRHYFVSCKKCGKKLSLADMVPAHSCKCNTAQPQLAAVQQSVTA